MALFRNAWPEPKPPEPWPAAGALQLSTAGKTLVMFVHPHCPCTRASLGERLKWPHDVREHSRRGSYSRDPMARPMAGSGATCGISRLPFLERIGSLTPMELKRRDFMRSRPDKPWCNNSTVI